MGMFSDGEAKASGRFLHSVTCGETGTTADIKKGPPGADVHDFWSTTRPIFEPLAQHSQQFRDKDFLGFADTASLLKPASDCAWVEAN
jgi:hypothetical protein